MKTTLTYLLTLVVIFFAGEGCTPQSRQDYNQAGRKLGSAAKSTGEAIKTDAQVAADAAKNGANAASQTVQHHNTSDNYGGRTVTTTDDTLHRSGDHR
ncbi:MAG: hypothetical protein QOJ65_619 [Fimbriimonadaceae bacterium]|jgi:general stress protein YciG|nr:hypothetical protein [Fimbriimonadaceae bacterium]